MKRVISLQLIIGFTVVFTSVLTAQVQKQTGKPFDDSRVVPQSEINKPGLVIQDGHNNKVIMGIFVNEGKQVVTADKDGRVKFWDAETGKLLRSCLKTHETSVTPASCWLSGGHPAHRCGGWKPPRQPPGWRRYSFSCFQTAS